MIMPAHGSRSKKRSESNSPSKLPKPLIFFIDRSLGRKIIAAALRQAGADVRIHDDHFPPDERDEKWLREVGRRGWVVLTKDSRIRYRGPEVTALQRARVRAFVLTRGDLQGAELAEIFVRALPTIERFVAKNPPPFIARIGRDGTVSMLFGDG